MTSSADIVRWEIIGCGDGSGVPSSWCVVLRCLLPPGNGKYRTVQRLIEDGEIGDVRYVCLRMQ